MARIPRFHPLALSLASAVALGVLAGCSSVPASQPAPAPQGSARPAASVSEFFNAFTDEWMRRNPSAATASRYFDGGLQARLDRDITPQSEAYDRETVALARRGLAQLAAFGRGAMSETERVSADLMRWQLQAIVDGERFRDTQFPLNQFRFVWSLERN